MSADFGRIFAGDGPFSRMLPRWQGRPGQVRMAEAVAGAVRDGGVSMIEAGTGTGKTLAYLVPAVLSGKKVIISTGTRTLQDQLFFKDIPLMRAALDIPFRVALVKGRNNYLCLHRFGAYAEGAGLARIADPALRDAIAGWARGTATGDRSELDRLPDDFPAWRQMSATSEQCLAQRCGSYDDCFVYRARAEAQAADIVVVNHHLFFADLALRLRGRGEVLPRAEAVVFDEAHQVEQVATLFLGRSVSSGRLADLTGDAEREWAKAFSLSTPPARVRTAVARASATGEAIFDRFRNGNGRTRVTAESVARGELETAGEALEGLALAFEDLDRQKADEALLQIAGRARRFSEDLHDILGDVPPDHVCWAEGRGRAVTLTMAPIELARTFEESILSDIPAVVFTSATLASGPAREGRPPDFAFVRRRLGVPDNAGAFSVESPFDYSRQTLLYLPRIGVEPNDARFGDLAAKEVERIVRSTRGRAFALFTSHRNLGVASRYLRGRVDYPLLVQGEGSRSAILEEFKTLGNAVLLATASFWEGVDVPGPALSCVIIDKLPFSSPGEPIEEARIAAIEDKGEKAFMTYQLPSAILSLRQGLGRLIRNEGDRGVLALLDQRVFTRSYGKSVLASLPRCPVTGTLDDVETFFSHPSVSKPSENPPGSPIAGQAPGAPGR
ncbi:MAG: ATP-dependent DNA helicase [Myxococcota bacterium]